MKATAKKAAKSAARRRQPTQRRARQTVEDILDAVVRVLKRGGVDSVTTNRIAEAAGVSIGSVYQYFPDKRAIFLALHDRHVQEISRVVERQVLAHAASSLDDLMRGLVEAIVDAHTRDAELHELLLTEVPHRADGARDLEMRLRDALRLALASRAKELGMPEDLDRLLFVLTHMVDSLSHGAVLRRPARLTVTAAKEEAVRAVMAYLRSETVAVRA